MSKVEIDRLEYKNLLIDSIFTRNIMEIASRDDIEDEFKIELINIQIKTMTNMKLEAKDILKINKNRV